MSIYEYHKTAKTKQEAANQALLAGIDIEKRKEWVAQRYRLSFQRDPEKIFQLMANPDTTVRKFIKELVG